MSSSASTTARASVIFTIGLVSLLAVSLWFGMPRTVSTRAAGQKTFVCTFLPVYVFALNVTHGIPDVRVEMLVPPETGCPHHYSVTSTNLKQMAGADAVIASGLDAEPFLDDLLKSNSRARLILLADNCDALPARRQAHAEPAATVHEQHQGHDHALHEGHDHAAHEGSGSAAHNHPHGDINPHVWASPRGAICMVGKLADELALIDPPNAGIYRRNAENYIERLQVLQQRMTTAAAGFTHRNIVTFHDAFAYLARDLNLNVVATLTVDPEAAPSAGELARVIREVRDQQVAAVFYEPAYSDRAARTVAADAGVPLYPLNPFNSVSGPIEPDTYERVMAQNLHMLQQALGGAK